MPDDQKVGGQRVFPTARRGGVPVEAMARPLDQLRCAVPVGNVPGPGSFRRPVARRAGFTPFDF